MRRESHTVMIITALFVVLARLHSCVAVPATSVGTSMSLIPHFQKRDIWSMLGNPEPYACAYFLGAGGPALMRWGNCVHHPKREGFLALRPLTHNTRYCGMLGFQPSAKIFSLVLLFNALATVIYLIPSWIVSSTFCVIDGAPCSDGATGLLGSSHGEGFLIVIFSLIWVTYTWASVYYASKGKFTRAHADMTKILSGMTILNTLQVAVWAGSKRNTVLDAVNVMPTVEVKNFYFQSLQAMIAGASLLLIGQVVVFYLVYAYSDVLFAAQSSEHDANATYQPSSSYDATQNYQNYQVDGEGYNTSV